MLHLLNGRTFRWYFKSHNHCFFSIIKYSIYFLWIDICPKIAYTYRIVRMFFIPQYLCIEFTDTFFLFFLILGTFVTQYNCWHSVNWSNYGLIICIKLNSIYCGYMRASNDSMRRFSFTSPNDHVPPTVIRYSAVCVCSFFSVIQTFTHLFSCSFFFLYDLNSHLQTNKEKEVW